MKNCLRLLFLALLVTGCAVKRPVPPPQSPLDIREPLLKAAQSIESSLVTLAEAQKINHPPVINTKVLVSPEGGMGGTTDIDWSGPIAPLLYKLGNMTGYRLKIIGKPPAIPVIVTITEQHAQIAHILKNAAHQAGRKATVVVYPTNRVIELRYIAT